MTEVPVGGYTKLMDAIQLRMEMVRASGAKQAWIDVVITGCAEDVSILMRHYGMRCNLCQQPTHIVCAEHRLNDWLNCPEVQSLWRRYFVSAGIREGGGVDWRPVHSFSDGPCMTSDGSARTGDSRRSD
jgi:hypothetical protein